MDEKAIKKRRNEVSIKEDTEYKNTNTGKKNGKANNNNSRMILPKMKKKKKTEQNN